MAVAAHARLLATPKCMNAPKMVLTLAVHASVMVGSLKSWEGESAIAYIDQHEAQHLALVYLCHWVRQH